jgi:hypothetical protein
MLSPAASPTARPTLAASPPGFWADMFNGLQQGSIAITGANDLDSGLQLSASNLAFFTPTIRSNSATSATLNVLLIAAGPPTTLTVTDRQGASVQIQVYGQGCGRPDLLNYAQLISPAPGAKNVPTTTTTYYVEVSTWEQLPSPFEPYLHAHIAVNTSSAVDPQPTLSPATPPPNAATPAITPPPNSTIGYESGAMPPLTAGTTYTIYVYDDSCESTFNAGSFST